MPSSCLGCYWGGDNDGGGDGDGGGGDGDGGGDSDGRLAVGGGGGAHLCAALPLDRVLVRVSDRVRVEVGAQGEG